jgi:hypothetical protein
MEEGVGILLLIGGIFLGMFIEFVLTRPEPKKEHESEISREFLDEREKR